MKSYTDNDWWTEVEAILGERLSAGLREEFQEYRSAYSPVRAAGLIREALDDAVRRVQLLAPRQFRLSEDEHGVQTVSCRTQDRRPDVEYLSDELAARYAALADADPAVTRFRAEHLPGGEVFASDEDAQQWLYAQMEREQTDAFVRQPDFSFITHAQFYLVLLPEAQCDPATAPRLSGVPPALRGDRDPVSVWAVRGGSLDTLGALAKRLADRFGWLPQRAAAFVLTGRVPSVPAIVETVSYDGDVPYGARITLDIHAHTPGTIVLQRYRDAQRAVLTLQAEAERRPHATTVHLPTDVPARRRARTPSPRRIAEEQRLASFLAAHPELKSRKKQFETWQASNPNGWRTVRYENFVEAANRLDPLRKSARRRQRQKGA